MGWRQWISAFAAVMALAIPPDALASTASVHTGGVVYTASPGETNDVQAGEVASTVTIIDTGAVIVAGAGCVQVNAHEVTCASSARVSNLSLGDLDDQATVTAGRNFSIFGGDGSDQLTLCSACEGFLSGGGGDDILVGGDIGSSLAGGRGNDTITGGGGRDIAYGGRGKDTIVTMRKHDVLRPGPGDDLIRAGEGRDLLSLYDSKTAVVVDLQQGTLTGFGTKAVFGVEDIEATRYDDAVFGIGGKNAFFGKGGDDDLFGLGGHDLLRGGGGNDALHGGIGRDGLRGGRGRDRLYGGPANDKLVGGVGKDHMWGREGDDRFRTRDGFADTVYGGVGFDHAHIDANIDTAFGVERVREFS